LDLLANLQPSALVAQLTVSVAPAGMFLAVSLAIRCWTRDPPSLANVADWTVPQSNAVANALAASASSASRAVSAAARPSR
jgi:hypothetical protein